MTMAPTIAPLQFESQIETLIEFESQNEMQPTKSESQFETPTSDPDLVPVRTLTPRAREDDATTTAPELPLLGTVPPTKCAHPHKHAWCDGRVHVPRDLHFEFFERLNTLPGETPTQKAGRLVAFYAATMAALPATQAVGDPYAFWKTAYVAWVRTLNETATVEHTPASPPYDLVWQQIRARIETKVNRHTFETWFRPLVMVTDGGSFIEVAARGLQSPIFADWITKQYADVVRAAVTEVRPGTRLDVIDVSPARIAAEYDRQRRSGT